MPGPSTQGSQLGGGDTGTRLCPGPQGSILWGSHRDQVQSGPRGSLSGNIDGLRHPQCLEFKGQWKKDTP